MRKLKTTLLLAAMAFAAISTASVTTSQADAAPKSNLVTICYYGVTMQVSQKIATRYVKIGAKYGACGEQENPCFACL
jgi:hypothetical protein